jgi:hypothetical protein
MVVLHRMVSCLASEPILESLPTVMPLLLTVASDDDGQRDLDSLVPLLNQLVIHYQAALAPVIEPQIMPFLRGILKLAPAAEAHEGAVLLGLQRHYLSVLHHLAVHALAPVLVSERNRGDLPAVLGVVVAAVAHVDDPALKRSAIAIFIALLKCWGGDAGFVGFLVERVVPSAVGALVAPHFKPRDANSARVVTEAAMLLFDVYRVAGPAFAARLSEAILPALGFPAEMSRHIGASLADAATAEPLEKALRACLEGR